MAHYQNGQTYYGQANNPQQSHPAQYGGYAPQIPAQEPALRRNSSFDAGDDSSYLDDARQNPPVSLSPGNGGGYSPYGGGGGNNLGSLHHHPSNTSSSQYSALSGSTTGSYGPPLTAYSQQQYQHQSSPPSQPAYNPQQYARPQTQYNPQAYGAAVNNQSTSYNTAYQPYVPAAYQSPPLSHQAGFSAANQQQPPYGSQPYPQSPQSQTYEQSLANYGSPTAYSVPSQPPPVPQRTSEQQYGGRPATLDYNQDQYYRQNVPNTPGSAPLPPRPSAYSPPTVGPHSVGLPSVSTFQPPAGRPHSSSLSYFSSHTGSGRNTEFETMAPTPEEPHHPPPSYTSFDAPLPPIPQPSSSFASRMNRQSDSPRHSPQPAQPAPATPQHLPQRAETLRHPQSRPLPGPPESESDSDYFENRNGSNPQRSREDEMGFDDLMKEVETEIGAGRSSQSQRSPNRRPVPQPSGGSNSEPAPLFSNSGSSRLPNTSPGQTNGIPSATGTGQYVNYAAYSDDSDAEAAAGLAAMQMAEEQEAAEDARRSRSYTGSSMFSSTLGSQRRPQPAQPPSGDISSDSDYAGVDVGLYSGGYGGNIHYGQFPSADQTAASPARHPSQQDSRPSQTSSSSALDQGDMYDYSIPDQEAIHPFPSFAIRARVDTGGTGGLSEPTPDGRKLSFDDGDEATLEDSDIVPTSGSQSPNKEDFQDLFFHPPSSSRPLPPAPVLIPASSYQNQRGSYYDQYNRQTYPSTPDAFNQTLLTPIGPSVPRSTSLSSHSSTPQTIPPMRSKTDADARAKLAKQGLRSMAEVPYESVPPSATTLDLPSIPATRRKKFNPSKLSNAEYKKCSEPWSLSAIVAWIKDLSEDETDLKISTLVDGIVALFTSKVPTMNIADAETLGAGVVRGMLKNGVLVKEEEWVKYGSGTMSGVLYQLTGTGCYSQRLHTYEMPGRCYSYHCMRTLKKVNLSAQVVEPQRKTEDWSTFYKVTAEEREKRGKKEVLLQNNLHEIVTSEDLYIEQLDILRHLYRDQLLAWQPPIIKEDRVQKFVRDVFGKVDLVKKVNEDYLLAQLKYRQQEQGPWIAGFSDIFREWIRKAKSAYIEYAASFPNANFLVRKEAERNILFKQFLDQARENKQSQRLSWDTFLKAPITRLQRYGLLLSTVHKNMLQDSEEKTTLLAAINEIKVVTLECDAKVAEMGKKVDLEELSAKLVLRKEMRDVDLRLKDLGREVIFRGDLQRTGHNRFTWLDTHAILFDHFLILAKTTSVRDSVGGLKFERYDVSKVPIPMDLLVLESIVDDAIQKSSVKGIGAVATVTTRAVTPQDARLSRTISSGGPGPGTLSHTKTDSSITSVNSGSSGRTMVTNTVLEGGKDEKVMYPFRVKHLGKSEVYTLYAATAQNRQDWCDKIIEAKTRHAASLFDQNAEPFRLRVLADAAFAYDSTSANPKSILIRGTPLDRAIRTVEKDFVNTGRPGPVCRAAVNCATTFNQPYGKLWCAVGTDYGVYISEYNNPRGWQRAIQTTRVTQIAVLEEFSLFLLISDKALIAYHLDVICPISGVPSPNDSSRRAPQKLSGARDVGFFAIGRMKDRTLVFYKKKEGISSIFKVLEPVLQKSTTMRSRFLPTSTRRGHTEFFRDFDDFYIPAECYSIHLFHSSLAIATSRGVEVLTLDKKQTWSVPNLKSELPDVQTRLSSIASMIKDAKPLGMFRLGESEFLVAFEECAVYINKNGDVSRSVVMYFSGRAKGACLAGKYLVLFNDDFVEVRNAMDGRLKQVIAGKDVKCLDDGGGGSGAASQPSSGLGGGVNGLGLAGVGAGPRTVKISMQHPEYERSQIVLEVVENEVQKEG